MGLVDQGAKHSGEALARASWVDGVVDVVDLVCPGSWVAPPR